MLSSAPAAANQNGLIEKVNCCQIQRIEKRVAVIIQLPMFGCLIIGQLGTKKLDTWGIPSETCEFSDQTEKISQIYDKGLTNFNSGK